MTHPADRAELPQLGHTFTKSVRVGFTTSRGPFEVTVYPEANPDAANRFLSLVRSGYYNGVPIHSVWRGSRLTFGINWREPFKSEEAGGRYFENAVTKYSLEPGIVGFSGHTGITINVQDLSEQRIAWPAAIGKVTEGLPLLEDLETYGAIDPDQVPEASRLWTEGLSYLQKVGEGKTPVTIVSARIVE